MNRKVCKAVAIVAVLTAVIGLIAYLGDVRKVNIGAFVFPAAIAAWAAIRCLKK